MTRLPETLWVSLHTALPMWGGTSHLSVGAPERRALPLPQEVWSGEREPEAVHWPEREAKVEPETLHAISFWTDETEGWWVYAIRMRPVGPIDWARGSTFTLTDVTGLHELAPRFKEINLMQEALLLRKSMSLRDRMKGLRR